MRVKIETGQGRDIFAVSIRQVSIGQVSISQVYELGFVSRWTTRTGVRSCLVRAAFVASKYRALGCEIETWINKKRIDIKRDLKNVMQEYTRIHRRHLIFQFIFIGNTGYRENLFQWCEALQQAWAKPIFCEIHGDRTFRSLTLRSPDIQVLNLINSPLFRFPLYQRCAHCTKYML